VSDGVFLGGDARRREADYRDHALLSLYIYIYIYVCVQCSRVCLFFPRSLLNPSEIRFLRLVAAVGTKAVL